MLNFDYPQILDLFREHLDPDRNESASFLIWYLENYYRLDPVEAVDSVCDQKGDKGVDGIFVNDNDETITIFQSRITQKAKSKLGDADLKEFYGTISQFTTPDKIAQLIKTVGQTHVGILAKRLDLVNKINTHELRGEYITNIDIDANGRDYLAKTPTIIALGKSELQKTYISHERDIPVHGPVSFDIANFQISRYVVDANIEAIIAPVKAKELVKLEGISDQSIYAYNVRGPLGLTAVNKGISASLKNKETHKQFPLFHNGITIIANKMTADDKSIVAEDYFVVNGCQSLTALYNNQNSLTDDLRLLAKFVRLDPRSKEAAQITEYSNNQNSIKARDSKANNRIQIRLQQDMEKNYTGEYSFEIKRGEITAGKIKISNEDAGLNLMAFDLCEPWATHRKYQVFDDKHSGIFSRPEVTADRIVFCQIIMDAIASDIGKINNKLFGKYLLTRYFLLYVVRQILSSSEMKADLFEAPEKFVRKAEARENLLKCIRTLIGDVIIDLNAEVDELGKDFDYRGSLRDQEWVKKTAKKVVSDHLKQINRSRITSFANDWKKLNG